MKQKNLGFTLVELIIVIAILAILSTGAIAGYSVYVEQANKAADEALIAEIENAFILAYYSDANNAGAGFVILQTDGITTDSSDFINNALTAAYGDYSGLALKYDGWTDGSYLKSLLSNANLNTVYNSTFFQHSTPAEMISSVSGLTDSLSYMAGTAHNDPINTMKTLNVFTDSEAAAIQSELASMGVSWNDEDNSTYRTALANLLVKKVSSDLANFQSGEDLSSLALLTTEYAAIYAWGTSTTDGKAALENLNAELTKDTANTESVINAINDAFTSAAQSETFSAYVAEDGKYNTVDAYALIELMGVVDQWSSGKDMTTPGLYSSDSISDMVKNYTSSVSTAANLTDAQKAVLQAWDGTGVLILIDATGATLCSVSAD